MAPHMVAAAELGYEELKPHLGYEGASQDLGYGYEDAVPDLACKEDAPDLEFPKLEYRDVTPDLGYEDAAPDLEYEDDLGYEDAAPDLEYEDDLDYEEDLGYEDAAPDSDSGYEVTPCGAVTEVLASRRLLRRMGHRSSFGGGYVAPGSSYQRRRATLDHCDVQFARVSQPSHHTRAPRRSSMATIGSHSQKSCRRVSFGGSPEVSNVEKLHSTEQEKQEMWYNRKELNTFRQTIRKILRHEIELDESKDCWRGLETYVRQHNSSSEVMSDAQMRKQIILQLAAWEQEQQLGINYGDDLEAGPLLEQQTKNLQFSAQVLLRKATKSVKEQAAQDAAEAYSIYMESIENSDEPVREIPASGVARPA